jgi:GH35 family endo-1,4-beta-xylanase
VQKLAEVSPDGNIPSNLMNRINKEGLAVVVSELDSTADKPTSGADKTKTELPTGTITQEAFSKLTSEEKDRVHRVGGKGTHNKIPSPLDSTQFIYVPKEQQ